MAEKRNPFPAPNAIRRYTREELIRRKLNSEFSKLAIPNPVTMPFVRFTSTKVDPGEGSPKAYRFFHMGLHGLQLEDTAEGIAPFGNVFEMTYGGQDVVGYAFGQDADGKSIRVPITSTDSAATKDEFPDPGALTNPRARSPAEGRHPVPGVTNVTVRHMGVNEPIETTVSWVCYNTTQLEFLRQHFLMAGGYVIIEFGNYWSNREQPPLFDFSEHELALSNLRKFVIEGRKFMSDQIFEAADGNYNMVIGRVVDQSISFQSDGTIHCTSTFYSTGEAVFGVHNTRLLATPSSRDKEAFSVTIMEFFGDNGGLDKLLSDPKHADFVVTAKARSTTQIKNTADVEITDEILQAFRSRFDSTFIPWRMFINTVMTQLFAAVSAEVVSSDAALFTTMNFDEPAIGNHPFLASTDPDTLVVVKSFMLRGSQEDEVAGRVDPSHLFAVPAPNPPGRPRHEIVFVSGSSEEKGLLTNGIWVNVGAIKESFRQSNTFYQGFIALLTRMNNAVENYWHLDLAFDEETQQYKIYDKKCVFDAGANVPDPYVFNQNTVGELLDLSFEANFSKESKTAILLASRPQTKKEAVEEMSIDGFNQPSIWTQVLNLPDLKDELGEAVQRDRNRALQARDIDRPEESGIRVLTRADNQSRSSAAFLERKEAEQRAEAEQEAKDEGRRIERATRLVRFADAMGAYIASPTKLIAAIAEHGRKNPNQVNNFVSPIPTEINLSMTVQGITGLAFYDTFLVDKLPRIYRDHGVFLINEIQHDVNPSSGWTTTIGGLYYFVNVMGTGRPSDEAVGHTDTISRQGEVVPGEIPNLGRGSFRTTIDRVPASGFGSL